MTTLDLYIQLRYAVEVVPDTTTDGRVVYLARHPELPGCEAHGETPREAIANLAEARELYLRSLLEDGIEPPRPQADVPTVVWEAISMANPVRTVRPTPALGSPTVSGGSFAQV